MRNLLALSSLLAAAAEPFAASTAASALRAAIHGSTSCARIGLANR